MSGQQQHRDSPPGLLSVVQVQSPNPSSDNLEFVITQYLRKAILVTFYQKKCSLVKQVDLRDMFKKAYVSVRKSTAVVSSDPVPPTISTCSARETPENTEENPDDPQPADDGGIQI